MDWLSSNKNNQASLMIIKASTGALVVNENKNVYIWSLAKQSCNCQISSFNKLPYWGCYILSTLCSINITSLFGLSKNQHLTLPSELLALSDVMANMEDQPHPLCQ